MPAIRTYIIEDSAVIRENLIATLEELAPVQVVGSAGDQFTALRWIDDPGHEVDLVIIDLFLSDGSGIGVLRAAPMLSRKPRLVVLSNFATPETRRLCLALGADAVFDKSHDIDALVGYCIRLAGGADEADGPSAPGSPG